MVAPCMGLRARRTVVRQAGGAISVNTRSVIAFATRLRMSVAIRRVVRGGASVQAGGAARRGTVCRVARLRLCEP